MYTMVSLGIGEIIGGLFIGHVIDKRGNKMTSIISLMAIVL